MADALDSFTRASASPPRRRHPDRARRDVRQAARRLRRRRPDRRHDRRPQSSPRTLPWAMAGVGALIGLPMFFEIGLVLLMPVIFLVARRSQLSVITRRHPGPGRPVGHARPGAAAPRPARRDRRPQGRPRPDPRRSACSSPSRPIAIAGPLFARFAGPLGRRPRARAVRGARRPRRRLPRPSFGITLLTVLTARRPDDGQGARRHLRRRRHGRPHRPRLPRHPAHRAAHRRHRRDVHPRPRRRHGPQGGRPRPSSPRSARSPASC